MSISCLTLRVVNYVCFSHSWRHQVLSSLAPYCEWKKNTWQLCILSIINLFLKLICCPFFSCCLFFLTLSPSPSPGPNTGPQAHTIVQESDVPVFAKGKEEEEEEETPGMWWVGWISSSNMCIAHTHTYICPHTHTFLLISLSPAARWPSTASARTTTPSQ